MFILWGFRDTEDVMGQSQTAYRCERCNNVSHFKVFAKKNWFTLFFVPLIPVSTQHYTACPICNYGYKIPIEEAKRLCQQMNPPQN